MGDSTWVTLRVHAEDVERAKEILGEYAFNHLDARWAYFEFSEVNYGELDEEQDLQEAGIPYDYQWGSGGDYGPGSRYVRYTPEGKLEILNIYDGDLSPPASMLKELMGKPNFLARYVDQYFKDITPLPWDNQLEYAKIYRARNLIES